MMRNEGFQAILLCVFPTLDEAGTTCCPWLFKDGTDCKEVGFLFINYTAIGRYAYFTISKCIERVQGFVRGYSRSKVH